MTHTDAGRTILTLHFVPGIGARTITRLAEHPEFTRTPIEHLADLLPTIRSKLTPEQLDRASDLAADNLDLAHRDGATLLTVADAHYPPLLRATSDRPAFLYVRGALQSDRTVTIIGTREPTAHGREITRRVTTFCAESGWSVVSGLALGVDALAHQSALEAGGHTVAVMAHGLQTVAPKSHRALADAILERGGALVSEYAYGNTPFPAQFVKRDRTQAGLAAGTIMIQSDLKGGSLHASRASIEYGRPLAVPVPTSRDQSNNEPKIQANLTLIARGRDAAALLRCRETDLHRVLPLTSKEDYPVLLQTLAGHHAPHVEKLF